MKGFIFFLVTAAISLSCQKKNATPDPVTPGTTTYSISANKAVYMPGESVTLTMNVFLPGGMVRYRHLSIVLKEETVKDASWNWQPPSDDYQAYLIEIFTKNGGVEKTITSIAVDVSSDWSRFPRYGFLSQFGQKQNAEMDSVIRNLARHHINGLQFYDWQDKHHQPLAGTIAAPAINWKDIANRDTYKATVQSYIEKAHQSGMRAMFYNLCYGALEDAFADSVQEQWYMYKDVSHIQKAGVSMSKPLFKSDIFLLDPSNVNWQKYLVSKNSDVYAVFNFDGYHIDQLGDWRPVYDYNGATIDFGAAFNPFIRSMKTEHPDRKLVFNAVNQFGQQGSIATAPVDFLYTEVWSPNEGFKDLASVIQNNFRYSSGKASVLAAYMNYNKASNPGYFNTPGVLLTNAVIFAFGGSHLELGEHMLCKEYFPNDNLKMNDELKKAITAYYDFLTAYENLLRDGGAFNSPAVTCTNAKMSISAWPPQSGKVAMQGKVIGSTQILHLINFGGTSSFDWRDTNADQKAPVSISDAFVEVSYNGTATKVWVASPDINYGIPKQLNFTQTGNTVKFAVPELKYWDMVVIE